MSQLQLALEEFNNDNDIKKLRSKYTSTIINAVTIINKLKTNKFNELSPQIQLSFKLLLEGFSAKNVASKINKKTSTIYNYNNIIKYANLNNIPINITESNIQLEEAGLTPAQILEINPSIKRHYNKKPKLEKSIIIIEPVVEYFKITVNNTEINIKSGTKGVFISNEGIFIKN